LAFPTVPGGRASTSHHEGSQTRQLAPLDQPMPTDLRAQCQKSLKRSGASSVYSACVVKRHLPHGARYYKTAY